MSALKTLADELSQLPQMLAMRKHIQNCLKYNPNIDVNTPTPHNRVTPTATISFSYLGGGGEKNR